MSELIIERDAAVARIKNPISAQLSDNLDRLLSWRDRSIEYQNQSRRWKGQRLLDSCRYEFNRREQSFPTGLLPRVLKHLDFAGQKYKIKSSVKLFKPADIPTPDWAWEHQHNIVNIFLDVTRCLIQAPTASGKSSSINFVVEKFPDRRVLVVAPSINLVKNLQEDLSKNLKEEIGILGDGNKDWQRVTVGTGRGLYLGAKKEYVEQMAKVDVLIFDEAHNYANNTGREISRACFNTAYRLGLSATTTIENGADLVLEGIIGPLSYVIPDTVMVDLDVIHRPKVCFIPVPDPKIVYNGVPKGQKPDRHLVYSLALVKNEQRNTMAVDLMKQFLNQSQGKGGVGLFVVNHINHGEIIKELCEKEGIEAPFISGTTKGIERKEILDRFRVGELRCLIASSILNEGEDVPLLELVINLAGGAGKKAMVQKTGRSLRKDRTGRKKRAVVIDFFDDEPYYLRGNSKKRIHNINERHPDCAQIVSFAEAAGILNEGQPPS